MEAFAANLDSSWTEHANCKGHVELFFSPAGEQPRQRQRREVQAAQLCLGCPVLDDCRSWAREHRESGFWAGETEEDRALAGYAPRATVRRSVARAAKAGRQRNAESQAS
ncbi:MAG TPA: WhiB family transcriptional regulator [Acidimicrobiales bacterium]|nr:WhiB family transcriptional regulator [Acidimicrobiales bacterium]